jgi:hypothetical protein
MVAQLRLPLRSRCGDGSGDLLRRRRKRRINGMFRQWFPFLVVSELQPARGLRLSLHGAHPMSRSADCDTILPARDEVIEALGAEDREGIGREWLRRAEVELTAATLSAQIARGLLMDGATREVLELAADAVGDEVRHGFLCHSVGERYLGRKVLPPRSRPVDEPQFGDCPAALNRLLGLVLHSCVSETLATVCLRDGLHKCASPTARAVSRRLLQDDLDHARLGWAHLASPYVDSVAKQHLARALPTLLRLGRDAWLDEPRPEFHNAAHGVLGREGFPELMRIGLEELVLPGFEHVGVDSRAAREWLARETTSRVAI